MKYRRTATMLLLFLLLVQSCLLAMAAEEERLLSIKQQNQENPQENTDCYKLILSEQGIVSFHFIRFSAGNLRVKWQVQIYNMRRERIAFFSSEKEKREHFTLKLLPGTYYVKIAFGYNPYHMTVKTVY